MNLDDIDKWKGILFPLNYSILKKYTKEDFQACGLVPILFGIDGLEGSLRGLEFSQL